MNRTHATHTSRSLAVKLASMAGAGMFTAAILATLVAAMPPLATDAALTAATQVEIVPSRVEVVGVRPATTVRRTADPHVG